jgi:hypothetical protein
MFINVLDMCTKYTSEWRQHLVLFSVPQYCLFTSPKHYLCSQPIFHTELQCRITNDLNAGPGKLYLGPTSKTYSTGLLLSDAKEQ